MRLISNVFKIKNAIKYLIVFMLCFTAWHYCTYLQAQNYSATNEYSLKAAYIYKFSQYTDWNINSPIDSFRVVIVGNNDIYQSVKKIAEVYKTKDKPIAVYQYPTLSRALLDNSSYTEKINILYTDYSTTQDAIKRLSTSKFKNTLLIGESDAFVSGGGHISFYREDNKIKFKINNSLINNECFKINSQLLKLGLASNQ